MFIAIAVIILNVINLDFKNLTTGNSFIALTGILSAFCSILLLLIFMKSKELVGKKL